MKEALIAAGVLGVGAVLWATLRRREQAAATGGLSGLAGLLNSDAASGAAQKGNSVDSLRTKRAQAGLEGALGAGQAILGAWKSA